MKRITNPDNNMWRSADPPQRMGYILCTPPEILAFEFKFGFFNTFGGTKIPALYPNLEIFPDNKFRMALGYPEWK